MKFPIYVPNSVRAFISEKLEGRGEEWEGSITRHKLAHDNLVKHLQIKSSHNETQSIFAQTELNNLIAGGVAEIYEEITCWQRLAYDQRMQQVYEILEKNFADDSVILNFIISAQEANINYEPFRQSLRDTKQLASEVAAAAETLAKLLLEAANTNFTGNFPSSFLYISSLLEKTDLDRANQHFHINNWLEARKIILGQSCDPAKDARDTTLRCAWDSAPGVAELLYTLKKEALACSPSESGFIGAALASRKHNFKTEYLRGFGSILLKKYKFNPSSVLIRAIAITTNIILNDPDLDVTYDDTRKAISTI